MREGVQAIRLFRPLFHFAAFKEPNSHQSSQLRRHRLIVRVTCEEMLPAPSLGTTAVSGSISCNSALVVRHYYFD
eukprot:6197712-Pleurochrysis_carterae.AAC.1